MAVHAAGLSAESRLGHPADNTGIREVAAVVAIIDARRLNGERDDCHTARMPKRCS